MANPLHDPDFVAGLRPVPTGGVGGLLGRTARPITGVTPAGDPTAITFDAADVRPVLLAFLSVDCLGCEAYWEGLSDAADGTGLLEPGLAAVRPVVVTRGPGVVAPEAVASVACRLGSVPVVMSSEAWDDFLVSSYPFFVVVDPVTGTVASETVGMEWADVHACIAAVRSP